MSNIIYQGDHTKFIKELFSAEFINSSNVATQLFLEQLLSSVSIEKRTKSFLYPTRLFERLNFTCGDPNPDLDYEIFLVLNKVKASSETILSILVTDILTSDEESLNYYLTAFSQQNEKVQGLMIEELLAHQHDNLPTYLLNKINGMIYSFASEFDISDGLIELEGYQEKLEHYKKLERYNDRTYF